MTGRFSRGNPPASRAIHPSMAGVFAALQWQLLLQGESHTKDRLGTVVVVGRVFGRGDFGCNREATLASKEASYNLIPSARWVRRLGACRVAELRECRALGAPGECGRNDRAGQVPCRWSILFRLPSSRRLWRAELNRAEDVHRRVARQSPTRMCS